MAGPSKKMMLRNVRGSYVSLLEPNQFEKFQIVPLIPKGDARIKEIQQACWELAQEKWSDITQDEFKRLQLPLHDGDAADQDGYAGHVYMNCKSNQKPGVLNKYKSPASEQDVESYGYSGCYFNISLVLQAYQTGQNKGVGAYLRNVMLVAAGEGLGGTRPEDDFKDVEGEVDSAVDNGDDLEVPFE